MSKKLDIGEVEPIDKDYVYDKLITANISALIDPKEAEGIAYFGLEGSNYSIYKTTLGYEKESIKKDEDNLIGRFILSKTVQELLILPNEENQAKWHEIVKTLNEKEKEYLIMKFNELTEDIRKRRK